MYSDVAAKRAATKDTSMEHPKPYICHDCGQAVKIEKDTILTTLAASYCPFCGSHALRPFTTPASTNLTLPSCFSAFNRRLLELLFQDWALNHKAAYPTFIDYVNAQLAATN